MICLPRRRLIAAVAALPLFPGLVLGACGNPTAPQTAGPFFKAGSPLRASLIEKDAKDRLVLTGVVMFAQCQPVANALLDFWHADEMGEYDNRGFRYRGRQRTDAQGRFRLETIVPAEYPGRARHIHVNVQPPGGRLLTTQLYFPGEAGNGRDGLYRPDLTMRVTGKAPQLQAEYQFVV